MNHSIYSADRSTHLKIVVVALIAATLVAGVGIAARFSGDGSEGLQASGPAIKVGKPVAVTGHESGATIR